MGVDAGHQSIGVEDAAAQCKPAVAVAAGEVRVLQVPGRDVHRQAGRYAEFTRRSEGLLALPGLPRALRGPVLAITSHLPHLIAYTIVGTASDLEDVTESEVIKYSAGGFRDFTRIAASDPIMWRDVFLNNREAVLEILQRFSEDLTALQRAIRWGEGEVLEKLFRRTREIRDMSLLPLETVKVSELGLSVASGWLRIETEDDVEILGTLLAVGDGADLFIGSDHPDWLATPLHQPGLTDRQILQRTHLDDPLRNAALRMGRLEE